MKLPALPFSSLERAFALQLTEDQRHKVLTYLELLRSWSGKVNLTSLEKVEDQLRFHFFESFWAAHHFLKGATKIADLGSGAGFPGLAMKLYRPALAVTLIEKSHKKVVFLKEVSRLLNLPVEIFQGRGEIYPRWNSQHVASIRALKPSSQLLRVLARENICLLQFASRHLDQLEILKQQQVPDSRDRYVTLFRPVPRETE